MSESLSRCDHQIVQSELKRIMNEVLKSDAMQHLLQGACRDAFLMLVKLHLVANQLEVVEHFQNRIHHCGGPRQDQRTARGQDAMGLAEDRLGIGQVLEYSQHDYMIELRGFEGQDLGYIGTQAIPSAAGAVAYLIIDTNAMCDPPRGKIQKSRIQSAT